MGILSKLHSYAILHVYSACYAHIICYQSEKNLAHFGENGKENNRQLRMKVRTDVNKRLVANKKKEK